MNDTIDLTYTDISDDHKGKHFMGISTQTVQDAVKRLESQYFRGRKIFRNSNSGSDYLFRWEICNLLKVLIWLEATDVFNSKKTKKSGVSKISIEKIISGYDYILKDDTLRVYERIALEASVDAKESKEILEFMQSAYQSMSRLFLLLAIGYNQFPNNIFKTMTNAFENLTEQINGQIYFAQMANCLRIPNTKVTKHGSLHSEGIIPLTLNLKRNVVNAINRIADEIYDFDDNGICRRKTKISDDTVLQERYSDLCAKHINYENETDQVEMNEEEINANGGIDKVRQELDEFMTDYFKAKYHIQDEQETYEDRKVNNYLRNPAKEYIIRYCYTHLLCTGKIDRRQWNYEESPEKCYMHSLNDRVSLYQYNYTGFPFYNYLINLEKAALKLIKNVEDLENTSELLKLVDEYVDQYLSDMREKRTIREGRFKRLESSILSDVDEVNDNVDDIKRQSEDLIKNMLAIILKLEDESKLEKYLEFYYGEITDLDMLSDFS